MNSTKESTAEVLRQVEEKYFKEIYFLPFLKPQECWNLKNS